MTTHTDETILHLTDTLRTICLNNSIPMRNEDAKTIANALHLQGWI